MHGIESRPADPGPDRGTDPHQARGTTGGSRWAVTGVAPAVRLRVRHPRPGCPGAVPGRGRHPGRDGGGHRYGPVHVRRARLSEYLGGDVGAPDPCRESIPILTTGLVPTLLLLVSWYGWLDGWVAVLLAELVILGRIASTGMVAARLRDERDPLRILLSGAIVAGVGLLIDMPPGDLDALTRRIPDPPAMAGPPPRASLAAAPSWRDDRLLAGTILSRRERWSVAKRSC